MEDQVGCAYVFQGLEGSFLWAIPSPLLILFCKVVQWSCNVGEGGDEGAIEVIES